MNNKQVLEALKSIKLVLSDLDGCLTDGGMYYNNEGQAFKKFNVKDGMGNRLLKEAGLRTGIITTDASDIVKARGEKLKIDFIANDIWDKQETAMAICEELKITMNEVAYLGDDVNDMKIMKNVGFSAAPADAVDQIKEIADLVLTRNGGDGAFRELADLILKAQGKG
ncbi:MAG: HAD-IIIA family hydrolase [Bacteroidetes bacterium]|nr:HAD-IIIA family hydrolase [Bacteroidota bacterium]